MAIRKPNTGGAGGEMGAAYVQAKVISIDVEKNVAICTDSFSRDLHVRLDIQRSKGQMPEEGETWIVDKYYGIWTFAALMGASTRGVVTDIENIPDLAPTLEDKQNQIDSNSVRMAGMQLTMTVTSIIGANMRYVSGTLSDGTAVSSVPVALAYYPQVGDTAWVLRQGVANDATSTPKLIAIGRSEVIAGGAYGAGTWQRAQVTAEAAVHVLADRRLSAPSDGVYKICRGQIGTDGVPIYTSWIDTIAYGSGNAPLERNNVRNIGLLWGSGVFYFTKADGTGESDINAGGGTFSRDVTVPRIYANNLSVTGNSVWSFDRDGAVRWGADGAFEIVNRAGTIWKGIRSSNFEVNTPSWRKLKKEFKSLTEHLGMSPRELIDDLDITSWIYNEDVAPRLADGRRRIGMSFDSVPRGLIRGIVTKDNEDRSSYDMGEFLQIALAAVQELSAEVRELRAGQARPEIT